MLGANFYGNLCKRLGLLGPSFPSVSFISTVPAFGLFPKLRLNLRIRTTSQNVVNVKTSGFPILLLQKAIPLVNMEPKRGHSPFWQKDGYMRKRCAFSHPSVSSQGPCLPTIPEILPCITQEKGPGLHNMSSLTTRPLDFEIRSYPANMT